MRKLEERRTTFRRIITNSPRYDCTARIRIRTPPRRRPRTDEVSQDRLPRTNSPLECREGPTEDSRLRTDRRDERITPRRTDLDRQRFTLLRRSSLARMDNRRSVNRKSCTRFAIFSTERSESERITRENELYRRCRRCQEGTEATHGLRPPPTSLSRARRLDLVTILLPVRLELLPSSPPARRPLDDPTTRSLLSSTPRRYSRKEEGPV